MNRLVAAALTLLCVSPAWGQNTGATPPASSTGSLSADKPGAYMQQTAPGDHWTYQVRDEISGTIKTMRTVIVTDVSEKEIATRFEIADTGRSGRSDAC